MFHYNCVYGFYFYVFSINTDVLYTEYFADDDQQVRDMNPARVGFFFSRHPHRTLALKLWWEGAETYGLGLDCSNVSIVRCPTFSPS